MRSFLRYDKNRVSRCTRRGLSVAHRRCLLRIMFLTTAFVLPVFSIIQIFDGNLYFALVALGIAVISLFSACRIQRAEVLAPWIGGYLVPVLCVVAFAVANAGASSATYVWAFVIPVLCYSLLGPTLGLAIAASFIAYMGVCLFLQLAPLDSIRTWLALLNPMFCGAVVLLVMHLYESMHAAEQASLASLATTDTLTGLANRNSFHATLERTIHESGRSNSHFALVLMDIDHFKQVNDTLGHDAGDQALQHVAGCLTERLRRTDAVGRLGGEEFGLILRDVDAAEARALTEHLRARIEQCELVYGAHKVHVTATFGIGHWPQDTQLAHELFQIADRRLYAGKYAGRNAIISGNDMAGFDALAENSVQQLSVQQPQVSGATFVQAETE